MYVMISPCIRDPGLRAAGITKDSDLKLFSGCLERCRLHGIETVSLPCPETECLGRGRAPGSFEENLDTPEFAGIMDRAEADVRDIIRMRGEPLCIIGVDSSPTCGVNRTYRTSEREPGRGAFLARFPEIPAIDVADFARFHVYLAGPLFTEAEQDYNRNLRDLLTEHIFSVYLPQEVGDNNHTRDRSEHAAIFGRHLAALRETDIVVAVVDGADADSGTSWEMGYASALGIPVISLRTDFRHAGCNEHVNLMLEESSRVVTSKEALPPALLSPLCLRG